MAGQVRLQDSAWLAQLAKQASAAASAIRKLTLLEIGAAVATPVKIRNPNVRNRDFISNLPALKLSKIDNDRLCSPTTSTRFINLGLANHELFDFVANLERSGEPTRLLASPRPCFGRLIRISILWIDARILPPLARRTRRFG